MATKTTMKAVWIGKTERVLKDYPIPKPEANEVLIKNVAVASNPKDWKIPFYMEGYSAVEGNDVAGHIESVGSAVERFKKGDKVAAFTKMRSGDQYGAYAEYSVSPENSVFHLGPKTSFEDAAAIPLAYMTAAIGLFQRLGLPTPDHPSTATPPIAVLIYGASTTVGVYAIQLAKLAGLYVVGIAGQSSPQAKSYGADELIDYRSKTPSEISSEISRAAQGRLSYVFDCISEKGTLEIISNGLKGGSGGGKVTYVLTYSKEELESVPKGVEMIRTLVGATHQDDSRDFSREWFEKVGEWLEEGKFRAQKVTVIEGGLGGVEEGLRRLKEGEVRAEKFVYRIAETEGI